MVTVEVGEGRRKKAGRKYSVVGKGEKKY